MRADDDDGVVIAISVPIALAIKNVDAVVRAVALMASKFDLAYWRVRRQITQRAGPAADAHYDEKLGVAQIGEPDRDGRAVLVGKRYPCPRPLLF